jgi:hypothetical protein
MYVQITDRAVPRVWVPTRWRVSKHEFGSCSGLALTILKFPIPGLSFEVSWGLTYFRGEVFPSYRAGFVVAAYGLCLSLARGRLEATMNGTATLAK